jgi:hypothetical protein
MLETATLSVIATALGSVVGMTLSKAIEKTADQLGEYIYDFMVKLKQFLAKLKQKSPNTARAIEESAQKPLDYGATIIDVQACIIDDPEFKNIINELAVLADNIQDPIIQGEIEKAKAAVQNLNLTNFPKLEKFADTLYQVNFDGSQTQVINIHNK